MTEQGETPFKTRRQEIKESATELARSMREEGWEGRAETVEDLLGEMLHVEQRLRDVIQAYDKADEQARSLRAALDAVNDYHGGYYYAWVPNEENHLETLSCTVVIPADWIRQLISEATRRERAENAVMQKTLQHYAVPEQHLGVTSYNDDQGQKARETLAAIAKMREADGG